MNGVYENTAKDMCPLKIQNEQKVPNSEIWHQESIKRKYLRNK